MSGGKKSVKAELDMQFFDRNVLWIGAEGTSQFSEGETMARTLILEYDTDVNAVGVTLNRSTLNRLGNSWTEKELNTLVLIK